MVREFRLVGLKIEKNKITLSSGARFDGPASFDGCGKCSESTERMAEPECLVCFPVGKSISESRANLKEDQEKELETSLESALSSDFKKILVV